MAHYWSNRTTTTGFLIFRRVFPTQGTTIQTLEGTSYNSGGHQEKKVSKGHQGLQSQEGLQIGGRIFPIRTTTQRIIFERFLIHRFWSGKSTFPTLFFKHMWKTKVSQTRRGRKHQNLRGPNDDQIAGRTNPFDPTQSLVVNISSYSYSFCPAYQLNTFQLEIDL
ncbi:hypothetical protein GDO81_018003 [Engystomops pustulosus]|uniref:Uncharacterized protein n=1 Tax=Engystomops pustulosus TaxID=76066 RepID=A0AAV7A9Y5_ENGPU|nr:hypothetical protein GDO81_018003 [Engystomops pustulosus]